MADTFLKPNPARPGTHLEATPVEVGGIGNAHKLGRLNAAGEFDESMLPSSLSGAGTITATASEALIAGPVNVYDNAGTLSIRKADATAGSVKPANAFVKAAVSSGTADVVAYRQGNLTGLSGLTSGAAVFLGKTPGTFTSDVSAYAGGDFVQPLGMAVSATQVLFELGDPGYQTA
jgi:hypothetical protein